MTHTTDNRWSPGSSGATVPDDATAAYAARWIDLDTRADIVPDRQGFAYNDQADRGVLIDRLIAYEGHTHTYELPRDETVLCNPNFGRFHIAMRRAGGYVYVDAWLVWS